MRVQGGLRRRSSLSSKHNAEMQVQDVAFSRVGTNYVDGLRGSKFSLGGELICEMIGFEVWFVGRFSSRGGLTN